LALLCSFSSFEGSTGRSARTKAFWVPFDHFGDVWVKHLTKQTRSKAFPWPKAMSMSLRDLYRQIIMIAPRSHSLSRCSALGKRLQFSHPPTPCHSSSLLEPQVYWPFVSVFHFQHLLTQQPLVAYSESGEQLLYDPKRACKVTVNYNHTVQVLIQPERTQLIVLLIHRGLLFKRNCRGQPWP
jgi:hypothetical protein